MPGQMRTAFTLYIGSYSHGGGQGIYRCVVDLKARTLSPPRLVAPAVNASFLVLHPALPLLYSTQELFEWQGGPGGTVDAYIIGSDGALTLDRRLPTHGTLPCHLAVHPDGKALIAANYGDGSLSVFTLDEAGRLGEMVQHITHAGHGPNRERQERAHTHSSLFTSDGRHLVVADLGNDSLYVYRVDPGGRLTERHRAEAEPGSGPRHMRWIRRGERLLVCNELANTLSEWNLDHRSYRLIRRYSVSTLPDGWSGGSTTAEVAVHPSERWAYVSNRGHDSLAVFALRNGRAPQRIDLVTAGKTPRHFALSPCGEWMVAAAQDENTLTLLRVLPTGMLEPAARVDAPMPVCVLWR